MEVMDRFNNFKDVYKVEPLYTAIYKLMYKGQLAGYRVRSNKLGLVDKKYEYYDLDLELVNILNQDLKGYAVVIPPKLSNEVNLTPKGSLLVPEEDIPPKREIDMCDYKVFMQTRLACQTRMFDTMESLEKSDYELKVLYNKYNDMIFKGVLPYDVPVYYDSKLKITAGMCNYRIRRSGTKKPEYYNFFIRISPSYTEKYAKEDNFRNVLIHEMIHVRHPHVGHKGEFITEMNRINAEFGNKLGIKVTAHSLGAGDYNYKYRCTGCGVSFVQLRKTKDITRYHCRKCKGAFFLEEDKKAGHVYDAEGNIIGQTED